MSGAYLLAYNQYERGYVIEFDVGDVLIARQDFILAGPPYKFRNARLHFCFDKYVNTCTREPNKTYFTEFDDVCVTSKKRNYYQILFDNANEMNKKIKNARKQMKNRMASIQEIRLHKSS